MSCPHCLKALQVVAYEHHDESCVGCGIRKLALMPAKEREEQLDRLQFACGWNARAEVVRLMRLEHARIAALKEKGR